MNTSKAVVRAFHEYWGRDSDEARGTVYFCGACELHIGGNGGHNYYGWPQTVGGFLAASEAGEWSPSRRSHGDGEPLQYYRFCPWCGAEFPGEWHRRDNTPVENDRVIDHFRKPGWHRGDTHEFVGTFENHWLSVSGGDDLCWCAPTVTPSITGCVIRHTAIDYDTYLAMLPEAEPDEALTDD